LEETLKNKVEECEGGWQIMRVRLEKLEPNGKKTGQSTWKSIQRPLS
jgi:hypothetical protein